MPMVQLFAIILGLTFGSFLNVVIYRLPRNLFFSKSRSFCPHCEYKIPFYSNIPVISYLIQGGECANCREPISIQYPIVELLSGLIWAWASFNYGLHQGILFIWMSSILLTVSVIDYKTGIIPFQLILSALLGLLVNIYLNPSELITISVIDYKTGIIPFQLKLWQFSFWGAIMGVGYLLIIYLLTSAIYNKNTLGHGDILLIGITGMWLGPVNVLLSLFLSALLALIIWGIISLFNGFDRNRAMPFGPYLSGSAIILYILDIDFLAYLLTI